MFSFKNKDEDPVISFIAMQPGMLGLPDILPRRSGKFSPSWWNDTPRHSNINGELLETVRHCPSFVDYFSQGFILPAWTDADISYDKGIDSWKVDEPQYFGNVEKSYGWGVHPHYQFIDHVDSSFFGRSPDIVFKAESPWKIITKPGWGVLQLPLFYHFDNDFLAMPGIIDTEFQHEVNIQMLYFGDGEKISIKRGDPLVQYVPFKKTKPVDFEARYPNPDDLKKLDVQAARLSSKFSMSSSYRIAQSNSKTED